MAKPTKAPLVVRIFKGRLSITIGTDTLAFALQRIENWPEEVKVIDPKEFARDVLRELEREEEDGSTPVHRLLDKVGLAAMEQGSIGCAEIEPDPEPSISTRHLSEKS